MVANSSTVTAVQKLHEDHFDYTFVSGGIISYYDDAYATSVLQKTNAGTSDWEREGYSCYPEPPYDNVLEVSYNSSECIENIQPLSAENIAFDEEVSQGFSGYKYFPFGDGITCYKWKLGNLQIEFWQNAYFRLETLQNGAGYNACGWPALPSGVAIRYSSVDGCLYTAGSCEASLSQDEALAAWSTILHDLTDASGGFGNDLICNELKYNGNGFRCLDKPKPPATKELAIERYASEYPPATICAPLKQNSPFQCTPTDTPPVTKELAIDRYASVYPPAAICAPLKQNSPFQCTRNVEVPTATIISLSVASAQAAFAVGGLVFVSLLRKLEKPGEDTTISGDDDLRALVRKLRVGLDELRKEFRDRQEELSGGHSRHEELIQNLIQKGGDRQA